ncbi:tripartite tricarboxylate transporter permease [Halogeometricum sp. CBA1124]|uniref:tripartite tricarboxylate transporter permease n=1 Tax=Halogeometricum sp. CBA1124 TaxID=2668071 RepID=UPI0031B6A732
MRSAGGERYRRRRGRGPLSPVATLRAAASGVGGGALVGYLPGVSAGVATVLALGGAGGESRLADGSSGDGGRTDRLYVVATSGADTATAVFAAAALVVVGDERSGVAVALSAVGGGGSPFGSVTALATSSSPRASGACWCRLSATATSPSCADSRTARSPWRFSPCCGHSRASSRACRGCASSRSPHSSASSRRVWASGAST